MVNSPPKNTPLYFWVIAIISHPQHVLHQLLPPPKRTGYYLRSRGHGLTLSVIPSEYMRKILLTECYTVIYINPNISCIELCLLCFMSVSVCMFALSTLRVTKFFIKEFYYYYYYY